MLNGLVKRVTYNLLGSLDNNRKKNRNLWRPGAKKKKPNAIDRVTQCASDRRVTLCLYTIHMRLALHLLGLSILTQALQRLRPFDYTSKNQHVLHSTRYTIEYTSKNAERHVLPSIILKHHRTADLYKSRFLPSPHNIEAVSAALEFINSSNASSGKPRPIILDSGCGTGKSTILLAKTFPSHSVIGIDRSLPRLSKSLDLPTPPPNLLFLRADLHDFYVLLASSSSPPPNLQALHPVPQPVPQAPPPQTAAVRAPQLSLPAPAVQGRWWRNYREVQL